MAATPQYLTTPSNGLAALTTANTALTGASAVAVFTAGASGGRIDKVHIHATGATTAGMIRLFLGSAASVAAGLLYEIPVPAITPSATQPAWSAEVDLGIVMQANYVLSATTEKTETFDVMVTMGGSF